MADTTRELVTCTVNDGTAHVRLARPDKLNALTLETLDQLVATARSLRADRTLRAVVLAGEGTSFCAGLDFGRVMTQPAGIANLAVNCTDDAAAAPNVVLILSADVVSAADAGTYSVVVTSTPEQRQAWLDDATALVCRAFQRDTRSATAAG